MKGLTVPIGLCFGYLKGWLGSAGRPTLPSFLKGPAGSPPSRPRHDGYLAPQSQV